MRNTPQQDYKKYIGNPLFGFWTFLDERNSVNWMENCTEQEGISGWDLDPNCCWFELKCFDQVSQRVTTFNKNSADSVYLLGQLRVEWETLINKKKATISKSRIKYWFRFVFQVGSGTTESHFEDRGWRFL